MMPDACIDETAVHRHNKDPLVGTLILLFTNAMNYLTYEHAVIGAYDYVFAENGLVAYKGDQLIAKQSLRSHLGEDRIKEFVNFVLHYVCAS
eukprot:1160629-Pelagomonas_calceolata.AAC.9